MQKQTKPNWLRIKEAYEAGEPTVTLNGKTVDVKTTKTEMKTPQNNGGKQMMTMYRGDPLHADDLSYKVLANPDRTFHVEVFERITGDTYRVRVIRCEGRDVDFTMPITGYCAGELYQQTRKVLALLVPVWNIPHLV